MEWYLYHSFDTLGEATRCKVKLESKGANVEIRDSGFPWSPYSIWVDKEDLPTYEQLMSKSPWGKFVSHFREGY